MCVNLHRQPFSILARGYDSKLLLIARTKRVISPPVTHRSALMDKGRSVPGLISLFSMTGAA